MPRDEKGTFEVALAALRRRERSTSELASWLAERGHDGEEIEETVERLTECGELDDDRFARLFAEDKRELQGWGPERIAAALAERGLERGLIERVCVEAHAEQVERAAELLRSRRGPISDDHERERALGYLTRRGYGYEAAYEAIRSAAA